MWTHGTTSLALGELNNRRAAPARPRPAAGGQKSETFSQKFTMRTVLTPLPAALLALASVPGRAGAFLLPPGRLSPSSHAPAPLSASNEISSSAAISDLTRSRQASFFGFDPPAEIDSDNTPPSLQVRALFIPFLGSFSENRERKTKRIHESLRRFASVNLLMAPQKPTETIARNRRYFPPSASSSPDPTSAAPSCPTRAAAGRSSTSPT